MIRRVLEQGYHTVDHERLIAITIFESGVDKEMVKQENRFSKRHGVLVGSNNTFEYK